MGCGDSCVKYLLFFFNLFFALCGLTLLGLGVAYKLKLSHLTDVLDGKLDVQPVLFIVVGGVVFVVAFFGCCGAVRESHCMLVSYAICMIVILIAQIILAVVIFVHIGDVESAISQVVRDTFQRSTADREPYKGAWAVMQKQLECCGVQSKYDYGNIVLPPSCCADGAGGGLPCNMASAYNYGCLKVISDYLKTGGGTLAGIAIGVAIVEIITVVFSLCFANTIRNADRRSRY